MHIEKVVKATGLTVDAIRFYEQEGLLPHPPRSGGGFRIYTEKDLDRLRFIRRVQALGFSLSEIRKLLAIRAGRVRSSSARRKLLLPKLCQVREMLNELENLERELGSALAND